MPKKIKPKPIDYYVWCICYIDSTYIDRVYKDLGRLKEYEEVEVYIPTVKVLKKTFKGEDIFDSVPLLFNYGFFKIPRKYASSPSYLENMKKNIHAIFAWVFDSTKEFKGYPTKGKDGSILKDTDIYVATATLQNVQDLVRAVYYSSIYSADDIDALKPGNMIVLRGYPFDNVIAEVMEVMIAKLKVKVKIEMFNQQKVVDVKFDNVFFTIYHNKNWDDSISLAQSLDAMAENASIDKQTFKNNKG